MWDITLGDGTFGNSAAVPGDVVGLSAGVAAIDAGQAHTCALTAGGGVKCWGNNWHGQIGDGTGPTDAPIPTPADVVGLDSGVAAVTGGGRHNCALMTTGTVKCWGWNVLGQLGDGTTTDRNTPVDVLDIGGQPLSGVVSISAGWSHTCVVTTGGGAKCWGLNHAGQLGDGTSGSGKQSVAPVDVVGLQSGVSAVTGGGYHTCALTRAGGVKCWGSNDGGLLGFGELFPPPTALRRWTRGD